MAGDPSITINKVPQTQNPNSSVKSDTKKTKWMGRTVKAVKAVPGKALRSLSTVRDSTVGFSRMIRLVSYGTMAVGSLTGKANWFTKLHSRTEAADGVIDASYGMEDPQYFFGGGFKKDNTTKKIGRVALLGASIGGLLMWLDEVKVVTLAKVGQKMASNPVLKIATKITLCTAVRFGVGVAFTCFAVDAGRRLLDKSATQVEQTSALWDLAHCVSEVALKVIAITGCVNPVTLGIFGAVAASLAIKSMLYNTGHNKELKAAALARKQIQNTPS